MIYQEFEEKLNKVQYVDAKAIREAVFDGFDEFVGTKAQIEAREKELEKQVEIEKKAFREGWQKERNDIFADFAKALAETYGTGNEKVDAVIYQKAWNEGHSGGLHDVEAAYMDFSDVAEEAFEQGIIVGKASQSPDRR